MTKIQRAKILKQVVEYLESHGWKEDKYGNYKKNEGDGDYRMKMQPTSIRFEVRVTHETGPKSWVRLRSVYHKDITIDPKTGKIKGWHK